MRRALPVCLVALFALGQAALTASVLFALWDAPTLPVTPRSAGGAEGCEWVIDVPAAVLAGPRAAQVGGTEARPLCVRSIAGVTLRTESLVREPGYLRDRAAVARWFEDQAALYQALVATSATEVVAFEADGREVLWECGVDRGRIGQRWVPVLPGAITVLGMVLVGSFVFLRRPDLASARALFFFCQGFGVCNLLTTANAAAGVATAPRFAGTFLALNLVGAVMASASLLLLVARFPDRQLPAVVDRFLTLVVCGVAGAVLVCDLEGLLFMGSLWATFAAAILALALMARTVVLVQGQVQRLQVRWVLWGLAVPLGFGVLLRTPVLFSPLSEHDPTDTLMMLFSLTIPVGIGVAVLRYRLLDIEVVIRRTLVGAVVVTVFLFLYHLVIALFAGGFAGVALGGSSFLGVFLTAVVFTFLLQPVQQRLTDLTDRVFFRNRYDYRQLLALLPQQITAMQRPQDQIDGVLAQLGAAMEIERLLVALAPGRDRGGPWAWGSVQPPARAAFWSAMERSLGPWRLHDAASEEEPLLCWLDEQALAILVPMRVAERLVGVVACSAPRGKGLLTTRDAELLANLGSALALALSHALAYETIQRMNAELELRVRERTAELEQARLQLYQSDKMASVGLLAASVAHELNTPLGVAISTAQQLAEDLQRQGSEVSAEQLASMADLGARAARQAAGIVQNLREFSRPSQQDPEFIDLRGGIRNTLAILGPRLRRTQIELVEDLQEIPEVQCFPALLNQVFMNLLLNAMQAMGAEGVLTIRTEPVAGGGVRITVQDTGPGVPTEHRDRVFEPFFTTKVGAEGLGLGLSLSYNIVASHGGRVRLDSSYQGGARFIVDLPSKLPARDPEGQVERGEGEP